MTIPSDEQIEQWYPPLFRTALRLTGNPDEAADVTQEAFCKAVESWDRYRGSGQRIGWLYRILVNCVRDRVRDKSSDPARGFDTWELLVAGGGHGSAAEQVQRDEQVVALRKAVEELPDTIRQAFMVTVLEGLSYEQAADVLGVPKGTVGSRVSAARKELSRVMRDAFPEA